MLSLEGLAVAFSIVHAPSLVNIQLGSKSMFCHYGNLVQFSCTCKLCFTEYAPSTKSERCWRKPRGRWSLPSRFWVRWWCGSSLQLLRKGLPLEAFITLVPKQPFQVFNSREHILDQVDQKNVQGCDRSWRWGWGNTATWAASKPKDTTSWW